MGGAWRYRRHPTSAWFWFTSLPVWQSPHSIQCDSFYFMSSSSWMFTAPLSSSPSSTHLTENLTLHQSPCFSYKYEPYRKEYPQVPSQLGQNQLITIKTSLIPTLNPTYAVSKSLWSYLTLKMIISGSTTLFNFSQKSLLSSAIIVPLQWQQHHVADVFQVGSPSLAAGAVCPSMSEINEAALLPVVVSTKRLIRGGVCASATCSPHPNTIQHQDTSSFLFQNEFLSTFLLKWKQIFAAWVIS